MASKFGAPRVKYKEDNMPLWEELSNDLVSAVVAAIVGVVVGAITSGIIARIVSKSTIGQLCPM